MSLGSGPLRDDGTVRGPGEHQAGHIPNPRLTTMPGNDTLRVADPESGEIRSRQPRWKTLALRRERSPKICHLASVNRDVIEGSLP